MTTPIEYLKGVGPARAELLKKEARLFTFNDLLNYFPFRYIDRTHITAIKDLNYNVEDVLVKGKIISVELMGSGRGSRLVAVLADRTGTMELVWFRSIQYIQKNVAPGEIYLVSGRVNFYMNAPSISHPEMERAGAEGEARKYLEPVYPSTEKLKSRYLGGRQIGKLTEQLFQKISEKDLTENLPSSILDRYGFLSRWQAYRQIHFPEEKTKFDLASHRLKFEELFLTLLRMERLKLRRHHNSKGFVFSKVGSLFNGFYQQHLSFELTGAQKNVLKEIRKDLGSGRQMNRLLQGDVGSGKTLVAVLAMLLAADNGFQSCLMAPTEILARQHRESISKLLAPLGIEVGILTGSTTARERTEILEKCANGSMTMITGTHALIEETVIFKNLGLAIVDEQHRFGVAQRARLWEKGSTPPHILVMTATPIPRTLALTAYGDLDYSVMDELPPGRLPVTTVHRPESHRPAVMSFIRSEIDKGRQVYFIYPLIEESSKLDYENLMQGYEEVKSFFPEPKFYISIVHGKQKPKQKQQNMDLFVCGKTQIMVSTTVIEVGVNVPNASVMVIESAEKFGLPQLHQLRGRVGRGIDKSYCILLTRNKPGREAGERLSIMCASNDGFKIAEKDLEIRGPGDMEGTRQSGLLNFRLVNLLQDKKILDEAHEAVTKLLNEDPELALPQNAGLRDFLVQEKGKTVWSKIS